MAVPGLSDFVTILEALEKKDDGMLWEAAKKAPSQAKFFDHLRNECGTTTFSIGPSKALQTLRHHSALLMVPMVLSEDVATLTGNGPALAPVIRHVALWLQEWFNYKVEVTLFNSPTPYEEICVWSPFIMREKLEQLSIKREPKLSLPPDMNFNLPPGTPRLAFFVAAVQRPLEFPTLPMVDDVADSELRSRIGGALQVLAPYSSIGSAEVLAPDFASEALLSGIMLWLRHVHETVGIGRWDAIPADQDCVILQLELGEDATRTSPVVLRAHQLGLEGIKKILDFVASLGGSLLNLSNGAPQTTLMN